MQKTRLLREAAGSALARGGHFAVGLSSSILLARILGTDGFGTYSFSLAVAALLLVPIQSGISMVALRFTATYESLHAWGRLRGLWRKLFIWTCFYSSSACLALFFLSTLVLIFEIDGQTRETLSKASFIVLFCSILHLIGGILRGLQRPGLGQSVEQILPLTILIIFIGMGFLLDSFKPWTSSDAMELYAVSCLISIFFSIYIFFKASSKIPSTRDLRYSERDWIRSIFPLTLMGGMMVINNHTDTLMLAWLTDPASVGTYRGAALSANLVTFVLTVINVVIAPKIAKMYTSGLHSKLQNIITNAARISFIGALAITAIFFIFGDRILAIAFGEEFAPGYWTLIILCLGQLISAFAGSVGFILNMTGHEKDAAFGVFIAGTVNIILNFLTIPHLGMIGAAIATASSMVLWNAILIYFVRKRTGLCSVAVGCK